MVSAILELIVLSVPSGIYLALRARHRPDGGSAARAVLGLRRGTGTGWALAAGILVITAVLGYVATRGIIVINPALLRDVAASRTTGLSATVGAPVGAAGYRAIVVTTLAEEMLFRGFIAGLLIRRLGFAVGNTVQAFLFLAPHMLLWTPSYRRVLVQAERELAELAQA
ncbi:CPBP family glutamic-type intramembrane protease [Amycolatopsis sp. H20-H5]|uniref:CPBP family glutamic-type intramembrane protease n=1 Tax=Amycolatopsis sp. H20-H5 TaxID=3046309 RepID=UPI002DB76E5E|nr:CPBP family glutamic-type intramembrane protease [Amycolatopsis sp. H20-H5]MEC3981662.1 CPBP family glutamic-type intramembrane protease [Amycolatopsis sp. H20-H5]